MNPKSFLLSKTFWLQVVTILSLALPQVRAWLDANPEQFVAALAAANVLLRFVTSGKISLTGGNSSNPGSGGSLGVLLVGTAGALLMTTALPSCSPALPPAAVVIEGPGYSGSYSAKAGLDLRWDLNRED